MSDDLVKQTIEELRNLVEIALDRSDRLQELGVELDEAHDLDHIALGLFDRLEELDAEVDLLWEALAEAVYMLAPEPEDILKGAGIYRIVRAYHLAGGALSNDIKDALQEMKEKNDGATR